MKFNIENARTVIYCRESDDFISFRCGCDLDWDDIRVLHAFFMNTLRTPDAKRLVDYFELFHDRVDYNLTLIDSTDENDRLQKISHQLSVNGYDLFIDGISYE